MTANERPLTDDAVAEITRRLEAIHGFEHKHYEDNMFGRDTLAELDAHGRWIAWDMRTPYSTAACEFIVSAPADIRALIAAYEALLAENARLREALKPFALTDDERCELGSFLDDEDVYMRPDDGNDSVKNGWRKQVTFGDVRRAMQVLARASSEQEAK